MPTSRLDSRAMPLPTAPPAATQGAAHPWSYRYPGDTPLSRDEKSNHLSWLLPVVVLVAALALAVSLYVRFLDVSRSLWDGPYHDRNAHYLYSLKLATALRGGRVGALLSELNEGRIWPPLHGVLAATVLAVGGTEYRLAVLPSLAGWVLTVLAGFLVARRAVRQGGNLAGLVAALFIAASPAHRAYATDVMLESLGAGLSLAVIYFYLLTVQGRANERWKPRCLAIALLALFLEKYNYWLLIVLALVLTECGARPRLYYEMVRRLPRGIDWSRLLRQQLRRPLNWTIASVLVLGVCVFFRGDQPLVVGRHSVSLYPPHNLIHVAYVLLFLRLAPWWWRRGRHLLRRLDDRLRQVILWHAGPLAVWFLLPKRPSYFLWYISPANRTPDQSMDVAGGLRRYTAWFVEDYHAGLTATLLAVGLCLVGLLAWRRLRRGGRALLVLAVLAAGLTVIHPNQKGRMMHSWIAAVWVTAGIGAAALAPTRRVPRLRPWLAGAGVAALACVQYTALLSAGHALEGGPHPERPCALHVTDAYLDDLDHARRVLILSAVPLKPLAQWTFLERHGSFDGLEERWYGFGAPGEENRRGFVHWLQTNDCDTVVYCESTAPRAPADEGPECSLHAELRDVLYTQEEFRCLRVQEVPEWGCRVEVWRRASTP